MTCLKSLNTQFLIFSFRRDLINRYANLYSQARLHTLDALDALPQLAHATQLKGKILFSVIVLGYRSAQNLRERKIREVSRCLCAERGQVARQLEASIGRHLRNTADTFPLHCAEKQVFVLLFLFQPQSPLFYILILSAIEGSILAIVLTSLASMLLQIAEPNILDIGN